MKTISRLVSIEWKNNPSVFEIKNRIAFGGTAARLGSAVKPVQKLLARSEELRIILPTVIGSSPNDPDWQDKCGSYLNDFFMEIPKTGVVMETGFTVDFGLYRTKDKLSEYKKQLPNKPADYDDEDWVVDNMMGVASDGKFKIAEEELYNYVTFLQPEQYIQWRFCILSAKVANDISDVNKSVNIDFYLTSEKQTRDMKRVTVKLRNDAVKFYNELIVDKNDTELNNYIIACDSVNSLEYYKDLEFEDKCAILLDMCNNEPAKLLALKEDKSLSIRARIIMYIWYGVLKTIPNSSTIVDAADNEKIIGNTMEEAISYFSNELHRAHVAELLNRYKTLK